MTTLSDDVASVIQSFIPHIDRFNSARMHYTNDFLTEGLNRKSSDDVKSIRLKLLDYYHTELEGGMAPYMSTMNVEDIHFSCKSGLVIDYTESEFELSNKSDFVNSIISLFHRWDHIINLHEYDCILSVRTGKPPCCYSCFSAPPDHRGDYKLHLRSLPTDLQPELSKKMFYLLILLVSILK